MQYRQRSTTDRFWEVLPGIQFWTVFSLAVGLSFYRPVWAAMFIVCFDLYWVLKALNVSSHLITAYRSFRLVVKVDWLQRLETMSDPVAIEGQLVRSVQLARGSFARRFHQNELQTYLQAKDNGVRNTSYRDFWHVIILPFVDESLEVLESTVQALVAAQYPHDRLILLLASEERVGESAQEVARKIKDRYGSAFAHTFITAHPDGLPGEIKGKSANASFAMQSILPELARLNIPTDNVLVANLDSDTIVHPQYFARVMYAFLTAKDPYHSSYQPIAIYNNNIWDSPAFIRVVSVSNSFWQFTESSRPDRLRTFSSHSMTLRVLIDVGFWKKDLINEDGYIFWQCYLHYNGRYQVIPLFLPISLDTCLADSFWQTLKNQYKQKRRWAYNVEYYPHLIPALLRNRAPLGDRLYKLFQYVEGNFNWATASVLITLLGWLPNIFGGDAFQQSVVGFNFPQATSILMTIATCFLIFSVYINLILLPPRPAKYTWVRTWMMYFQWFLVPITSVVFGSLPAIEAQTRLMIGRYLEFWVTPKARKGEITAMGMKEMQSPQSSNESL